MRWVRKCHRYDDQRKSQLPNQEDQVGLFGPKGSQSVFDSREIKHADYPCIIIKNYRKPNQSSLLNSLTILINNFKPFLFLFK